MQIPRTYSSMEEMLTYTAEHYRRDSWQDQDAVVQIWPEKDALAGVLSDVTSTWNVPLMVSRGYASLSFLHYAAEIIADQAKPTYIYFFGDHDPSGKDITRNIEDGIREFAPESDVTFERIAVIPEQIIEWDLPTRPTKTTDPRAKSFKGESGDVDAIPPQKLRDLAEDCIVRHIDMDRWKVSEEVETAERDRLNEMIQH